MKSLSLKEIRTEIEALEKEIRLQRTILEVIPEPFFILDREGDFLKANPRGPNCWDILRKNFRARS